MKHKQLFICICSILLVACQHKPTSSHGKEPGYVHGYNILRNFIGTEPIPDNWILQGRIWRNDFLVENMAKSRYPISHALQRIYSSKARLFRQRTALS